MDNGLLPRRYAKALYKYALEQGQAERVYEIMLNLKKAYETEPELEHTLSDPYVSVSAKITLLEVVAGGKDDILANAVNLLAKNNRLDILRGMVLAYIDIYRKENGIHPVEIISAQPLNDADRDRLVKMIEKHIGRDKAEYTFATNPDLIGGFVVRVDNESLDASVRNELNQLRQKLMS